MDKPCHRCGAMLSTMLPPSDGPDKQRCDTCGHFYWLDHDGVRHVPPGTRYAIAAGTPAPLERETP